MAHRAMLQGGTINNLEACFQLPAFSFMHPAAKEWTRMDHRVRHIAKKHGQQ